MAKVALAYSGGLDTSVAIRWLQAERGYEVVACAVDVGQGGDMEALRRRALDAGAAAAHVVDARERFAREYLWPALKANAVYENGYLMHSALSRPLITEEVVRLALREGCDAFAHGCTAKGNDQARFEAAVAALAPDLRIVAPVREWEFRTREEEMDYAAREGIPVPVTRRSPYSIDRNLWGVAIECGVLEDPMVEPPADAYQVTVAPEAAPDAPQVVEIAFEQGEPVAVDGEALGPVAVLERLNDAAGRHGVGRLDMVENRLVGIKSREIYEAPGPTVLMAAHRALEQIVLSRDLARVKEQLAHTFANIIYDGCWFSDLREALQAFIEETQRYVTGTLRVRLFKGSCAVVGRRSDTSLYRKDLATYGEGDAFDRTAAEGFLYLRNLPLRAEGERRRRSRP